MALLIQVASVITVWSRVLCNRIEFGKPATFTMPVIERFPIAGSFLFTPLPGRRGECLRLRIRCVLLFREMHRLQ